MRFAEWNMCGGLATKLPVLEELGCDAAVLCEVPQGGPIESLLNPLVDWQWVGQIPGKGLALATFGAGLTAHDTVDDGISGCGIAATLSNGLALLGIWTHAPRYGEEAIDAITAHAEWLRESPGIVAGDFNAAPMGTDDTRTGVLRRLFAQLRELGYRSAYHHYFREEYGFETRPTYFHRRKAAEPFHIDFCFLHESLLPQIQAVEVGRYEQWVASRETGRPGLSDHVPTIVDLDL